MNSFTILGTGSSVPPHRVTNDDLAQMVDTSDEWISTRTGIRERRVLTTQTLTDLAVEASRRALEQAQVSPKELDLIICTTLRGDYLTPAEGCVIQEELGASCPAFDLNAACSGFVYALDVAAGYYARGAVKKVLIVSMEAMSQMLDWTDRSTCVLFGDGAGAVVLGEGDDLLAIALTAKGNREALSIPHIHGHSPFLEKKEAAPIRLSMQGQEVYKFAVSSICRGVKKAMGQAGLTPEKVDHVLFHQANMRIIEAAQKRLGIPDDRYHNNIDQYGNTSSASVVILLDEVNRAGLLKRGETLVLCAFGGGLTTGTAVMRWSR